MTSYVRSSNKGDKLTYCQRAKLCAGIKPTALCSAFDKENSIEFLLDLLHYIYNYYVAMLLWSPCDCDCDCDMSRDIFLCFTLVIKEKKKKRDIK